MPKRVLWLDNDLAYLTPFIEALHDEDYEVEMAESVTEAERSLEKGRFDLVIMDVMIPTKSELEEKRYKPEETQLGYKTGLLFYIKLKDTLEKAGTKMMVMTVRLDKAIMDEFIKAGLSPASYATKYEMSEPLLFLGKVQSVLGRPSHSAN